MPTCHSCDKPCADFKELALHIIAKKHRKGRKWAARYIMMNGLSPSKRFDKKRGATPLTSNDISNKEETRRVLSGAQEFETTICLRCKQPARQPLPVEYTKSKTAWRIQGLLVVQCSSCRGGS